VSWLLGTSLTHYTGRAGSQCAPLDAAGQHQRTVANGRGGGFGDAHGSFAAVAEVFVSRRADLLTKNSGNLQIAGRRNEIP
jgi:hypothetical protein